MKQSRTGRPAPVTGRNSQGEAFDLTALMHPAQAFERPMNVVEDWDLTLSEKRAILAAWASDACAVEAAPALRRGPGQRPVLFDEIIDALRLLDRLAAERGRPLPHYRRVLEPRAARPSGRFDRNDDQGPRLH
jgi:hypothetical protein